SSQTSTLFPYTTLFRSKNSMPQPKQFFLKKNNVVPSLANSIRILKSLKGKIVSVLNLIMWPPLGELEKKYIIFSCSLSFTDNSHILIDTAGNQYSMLVQEFNELQGQSFPFSSLNNRIEYWQNFSGEMGPLENEIFYADKNSSFQKFIGKQIQQV